MFQHLDLSEQKKLRYFLQGLRREIRREILIKQPKTYREAEDAAKLLQMVDSFIATENSAPNQLNYKIIDAVVKVTMAAQGSLRSTPEPKVTGTKSEAAVNAYQYSPQDPNVLYDKVSRLEQGMQQLLTVVGNRPQDTGPNIAAYQPAVEQSADEELRYLQEPVRQLFGINSEEHFNVIAAYQPSTREHNHSASEWEELRRLRKKIRLLKLAQRGPQQPQQFQNRMNYSGHDAFQFQERMRNEIRRMQARIDRFMKAHANRNNRQEQPRVRTR